MASAFSPGPLGHRPALDGVRALAVTMVVAGHVDDILLPGGRDPIPGGFLGVDVFFVLSGFLITRLLLDERTRQGRVALGAFYGRRAARLLPAVAVLLAAHVLWVWRADVGVTGPMEADSLLVVGLYVSNWAHQLERDLAFGLGHLWSLSVEEQFYLVWPFVLWATRRRAAVLWGAITLGIVTAITVRHVLWQHGVVWLLIYIRTDARMDALLLGCALAVAHHRGWLELASPAARRGAGVVGLVVVLGAAVALQPDRHVLYGPGFTLVALGAAALVAATLEPGWWLAGLLSRPVPRALGRVSYGVYLWHVPVFSGVVRAWPDGPAPASVGVALLLTAVAVTASWFLVERPVLDWARDRRSARARVLAAASTV